MIQQIQFTLRAEDGSKIPQSWAYSLYGWLMQQLPPAFGDALHLQGEHPLTHFLHFSKEQQAVIWTINLLNDQICEVVLPILEQLHTIHLHTNTLNVQLVNCSPAVSARDLIQTGRTIPSNRAKIALLSPCAFKQSGRYAIFPQESLLLQSLILHWNSAFPEYQLTDMDVLDTLLRGLHLVDYDLHTVRYALKGVRIPSFLGSITLEAQLALPLLELWNTLLAFAPYGGIGIKTTLGMGGAALL